MGIWELALYTLQRISLLFICFYFFKVYLLDMWSDGKSRNIGSVHSSNDCNGQGHPRHEAGA